MYDLLITWHDFCDQNVKEILRATGITLDAAIEILKMYQCSPSLHISIYECCELYKEDRDARLYNETDPKSVL